MELNELLRVLRRSWMILVSLSLLGLLAGGLSSLLATKTYQATTQLYVSVQAPGDSSAVDIVQGSSAAQAKVRSYITVVTSPRVLQPVIKELGLKTSPGALASRIQVSSNNNTVLLKISASDPDPTTAARIANAVSDSFSKVVVSGLEAPTVGTTSLVRIESIQTATPPGSPSSPNTVVNLSVGLLLGLLAGLGTALLRHTLDTRVQGAADVASITDVPVIGGIGFDPEAAKHPLIVHVDPRSPRAESFRALRTNLFFLDPDASGRSYVISSAMPSEGKSTTTANLAIALAESGASVALVDADLRRPRLAEIMGIEGAVGLTDVLVGRADLEDVLQPWGRQKLSVLPAGRIPPNPSEILGSGAMRSLLDSLSDEFDFVLVDAPPLLPVTDAAVLSKMTTGVLLVASAMSAKRNQIRQALTALESIGSRTLGIVMTKLPVKGPNAYGYGHYHAYYGVAPERPALPEGEVTRRSLRKIRS
jgi:capsular exopolysaccharide synthesis family protein